MAIINAPSTGFDVLLQTLMNKEQLAQQKEELNLRKKDFELRANEQQMNQAIQRARIEGARAAAGVLLTQRPDVAQAAPTNPNALPFFLEQLQGFQLGQAQVAGAEIGNAGAASDVRVKTGTEGARIAEGNLAPAMTQAQIARIEAETQGINLNNALLQARKDNDPARVTAAWAAMENGGVTWGQAVDAWGLTGSAKTAFPSDFMVTPTGGAGGETARKAASMHTLMQASNSTINSLIDDGTRLGFIGSMNRSSSSGWFQALSNTALGDKEQSLIQAQKTFSDMYRFFISGQQSAVAEAERIMFTMMENANDGPETIAQKRFMRSLVIDMANQVAGGTIDPVQAATRLRDAARAQGFTGERLEVFEEQLNDARAYVARGGPNTALTLSANPTSLDAMGEASKTVDDLLNATFR